MSCPSESKIRVLQGRFIMLIIVLCVVFMWIFIEICDLRHDLDKAKFETELLEHSLNLLLGRVAKLETFLVNP